MYQRKYYRTGQNDGERSYELFNENKEHFNPDYYFLEMKTQLSSGNNHSFESGMRGHTDYKKRDYTNRDGFHDSSSYWERKGTDESDRPIHGVIRHERQGENDEIETDKYRAQSHVENNHQFFFSNENSRTKSPVIYTRPSNKIHAAYHDLQRNEVETSFTNDERVQRNQRTKVNPLFDGKNGGARRFSVDDAYSERRDSILKQATNHPINYVDKNNLYINDTRNISKQQEDIVLAPSQENTAYFYSPSSNRFYDDTVKYNETDTVTPTVIMGVQHCKSSSMIPTEYTIYAPSESVQQVDKTKNKNAICSFVLLILCSMLVLLNGMVGGYMNYQIGNLTCYENLHLAEQFNFATNLTDICEKKDLVETIVRVIYSLGSVLTCLQIINIIIIVCHRVKLSSFSGMSGMAELHLAIWVREIPQVVIALSLSFPCTCDDSRLLVSLVIVSGFVVGWVRFLTSFPTFQGESGCLNLWWRCLCCKESSHDIEDLARDGSEKTSCDIPCIFCCSTVHLQKSRCRIQCWCFDIFKRLKCICTCCDKDRTKYGHRLMNLVGLTILTLAVAVQIITLL